MRVLRDFKMLLVAGLVSGCGELALPSFGMFSGERPLSAAMQRSKAPRQVIVSAESFTIEGPTGFCPDVASINDADGASFVALATCSRMKTGDEDASIPALLTVALRGPLPENVVTGKEQDFIDFLETDTGRAALARSGQTSDVTVTDSLKDGRAVYVWVADTSDGAPAGTQSGTWRGFFDLNGRMVSMAAYALTEDPFNKADGLTLLQSFEMKLRAENLQNVTNSGA